MFRILIACCLWIVVLGAHAGPVERDVESLYALPGATLWWADAAGHPNASAVQAMALLSRAPDEGLAADDYRAAPRPASADPGELAAWDRAISTAVLHYLRDLHLGRVDPRALGFQLADRRREHDFGALLRSALERQQLPALAAELTPAIAPYRDLRTLLARYRALAAQTTAPALAPLPAPTRRVRPGDPWDGVPALRGWLGALGDLAAVAPGTEPPAEPLRYDEALSTAVAHFQRRHGLEVDGVIGRATWAELQVPLAQRVRQIELALERLRWLPHLDGPRGVAVNIPMFRLRAWDATAPQGKLGMGVIVGKALDTRTPVFVDEMTHLIFRPYWNVPRSIVRNEVLPALARNPAYLARQGLQIVRGPGDDAQPVATTPANIELLREGVLRLRQPPGARNALGLVKFVFPNDADVYMHGTPAQQLFGRARRDFSHGCVRLEDPVALATWLLRDQPGWTREAIVAAMNGTHTRRVDLAQPLPVLLYYLTAFVSPDDGSALFAQDVYRHDAKLEAALSRPR